jgi:hypothetical protein
MATHGQYHVYAIMIFAIASMLTLMEVGGTLLASRQPRFFAPPANVLGLSIEEKDQRFSAEILGDVSVQTIPLRYS